MKIITIKLTKLPRGIITFSIYDQFGNVIALDVPKNNLIAGISYEVEDDITMITLVSKGDCILTKTISLRDITTLEYANIKLVNTVTGCLWTHLNNSQKYNTFYGVVRPYIIEYPFSYQNNDEILQNVKDYTKSYKYLSSTDLFNDNTRIETNNNYFNKAVLYNGQQSSGILKLVEKKPNDLYSYVAYPLYNIDSKTILYTKSDNFYQYNTFWALNKSSSDPLFISTCINMSIDKEVNQDNMDYSSRSFRKAPLRAKELKVRHILDDKSDVHLVSQFILTPAQISFK
jgi:hypothetical protein